MIRTLAFRLALLPPLFVLVSFTLFLLIRVGPGHAVSRVIAGEGASPAQVQTVQKALGEDGPFYRRYGEWIWDFAHGDFGSNYVTGRSVRSELGRRIGPSLEMLLLSTFLAALLGTGLATMAATARRSWISLSVRTAAAGLSAIPDFAALTLLIILPSMWWNYSPPLGYRLFFSDPWSNLRLFGPPALIIAVLYSWRATASVLSTWTSGEVGKHERTRALTAAFLAAFLATLPLAASSLIVFEIPFAINGVGSYLWFAVQTRDLTIIHTVATLTTFAVLAAYVMLAPSSNGPVSHTRCVQRIRSNPVPLWGGLILIVLFVLVGAIGPLIAPHDPAKLSISEGHLHPSWVHPLGTSQFGQDMLSRVLSGGRATLKCVTVVLFAGFLPGVMVGAVAARARAGVGWIGREIAFVIASAPLLVLMLAIVGAYGPGLRAVTWVVAGWAFFVGVACTVSSESRAASTTHLVAQAISSVARVVVTVVFAVGVVDFLGVGSVPFDASWGADVSRGLRVETGWYLWFFPLLAIFLATFGFYLTEIALTEPADRRQLLPTPQPPLTSAAPHGAAAPPT